MIGAARETFSLCVFACACVFALHVCVLENVLLSVSNEGVGERHGRILGVMAGCTVGDDDGAREEGERGRRGGRRGEGGLRLGGGGRGGGG
jgi:hypothetical protein